MKAEKVSLGKIVLNDSNPRTITDEKFIKLVESILVFPKMLELRPVVLDENYIALGGNMRTRGLQWIVTATQTQIEEHLQRQSKYRLLTEYEQQQLINFWLEWKRNPMVYCVFADDLTEDERNEFIVKDNVGFGSWDMDILANEFDEQLLLDWGMDVWQMDGGDDNGAGGKEKHGSLLDKFVVPPFTILDTRQGYWRERKEVWRALIDDNGESREGTLANGETNCMASINNGVSLLDPVMAEIVCRWFGIEGGKAFDCFAGDTVFGYVAATLGHSFTGIELREEQAALNNERVAGMSAEYICDDGQNVLKHIGKGTQDLLFSCPPYFDLEVYSDKPNDASNQSTYKGFLEILDKAFTDALVCLKDDRFAAIVVGDIRDKQTGFYHDFVSDIKDIFKRNGAPLYNEMIIIEPIGTLPQRVQRYMKNRKVGKCHQNVLVFYKGDPDKIKDNYKLIEYASEDLESFGMDNGDSTSED
ncbi:DNA modification methylase [Dysgonomonas sp. PFB1-18]|uniref:site-specific DNA-methyltransferase n=1 Tax=unclassified Dysgonomonas TaxID=2630389 RepID=UPI002474E604|nr:MULTISPECIES: site-specific DNA-methyltransferase [unclassified Dysgonomonas]MDH6308097.1 DNA modification methylase [Dysgonomonas sp. PF1-14]MDH6339636.1 DNA modification methylase [Dysgonomonas sp. PF1-16]MDH6381287.1 DNA modification methylase [Dysgonomonas sp. PFB1-18]MDH6398499.1 DNA modification methylase [Dysgonomonas sp. PF1-23]